MRLIAELLDLLGQPAKELFCSQESAVDVLVLWYYSTVVLCYCGTVVLWYFGNVVLRYFGNVVLWYFGTVSCIFSH